MARTGKYSKEMVQTICEHLITGATAKSICDTVNISESTFYEWKSSKPEFSESLKKAEEIRDSVTGKTLAIHSIFQAMKSGVWQAGAWWLERKFPAEFKNVQEKKVTYDIDQAREKLGKIIDAKFGDAA